VAESDACMAVSDAVALSDIVAVSDAGVAVSGVWL
jgi:hypothetical protein